MRERLSTLASVFLPSGKLLVRVGNLTEDEQPEEGT
jgi:hypothetical protein